MTAACGSPDARGHPPPRTMEAPADRRVPRRVRRGGRHRRGGVPRGGQDRGCAGVEPGAEAGQEHARDDRPGQAADDPHSRLGPQAEAELRGRERRPLRHDHARPPEPSEGGDGDHVAAARPQGTDPRTRRGKDQRVVPDRGPCAHARHRQEAHRAPDQPRNQRDVQGILASGERDRVRLGGRRPRLFQRKRGVHVHRHRPGLPATVCASGAPVRALPPHGRRPGALGAPAGLPAPGEAAGHLHGPDLEARPPDEDLRPQHGDGCGPAQPEGDPAPGEARVLLGGAADPGDPLRGRDRAELRGGVERAGEEARAALPAGQGFARPTRPRARRAARTEAAPQAAPLRGVAEPLRRVGDRRGPGPPDRPGRRRWLAAGLLPDAPPQLVPVHATAARVQAPQPGGEDVRRLPHGHPAHERERRVLRPPRDDLEKPADPRGPLGDARDGRARVRAALRGRPAAAGRVAHPKGGVLDLEHAASDADGAADSGHRPLGQALLLDSLPGRMDTEPIGVVGAGWVGLVTAACFAELGHEVWARDIVPEKVESLRRGEVPIHEPGLPELVKQNAERLHFTTDMRELLERAQLLFVCVDTPPTYSGDADLSRVEAVLGELGDSNEHALVMKSTVPVGTGRSIERRRERIGYVSNPEFLKEGSAVDDFMKPDRVVVGADGGSKRYADRVEALYAPLGAEIVRTDVASAEMIKLASNAFLATKISFINEIANVSEELGADVREVARGMGLDDRIGPKFLQAGVGFGGSCFPKDVQALKQLAGNSGYHFQLLTAVVEVNELQKRRTISKLQKHLGPLAGKEVALLGVAFKPDTDDIREATSLVLAGRLAGEGASVRAYDPVAGAKAEDMLAGARIAESALDAIDGADAVVLVTEWPEFRELDWTGEVKRRMRVPLVVDGRNFLDREQLVEAGFTYEGIGR